MTTLTEKKKSPLSRHLTALNTKNEYTFDPDVKDYPAFIVNRCLSYHPDCIFWCNELNQLSTVTDEQHYAYLFHAIRKKNRFAPWAKATKDEVVEAIMKCYGYSKPKAIQASKILTNEQIQKILEYTDEGGKV